VSSIFRKAKEILKLSDMKSGLEMEKEYLQFLTRFHKDNV